MSSKHVKAQLVTPGPQGDETHAAATSADLDEYDWEAPAGNLPNTHFVGHLAGKRTLAIGVEKAVLDIGLNTATPGDEVFTVQGGVIDTSLRIPHNNAVLADWDRNHGVYIAEYAEQLGEPLYSGESNATSLPDHSDEAFGNLRGGE